jgi:hypothetical protein
MKITDDAAGILGLCGHRTLHRLANPLLRIIATPLAKLAAGFELQVTSHGFSEAARQTAQRFTRDFAVRKEANIPDTGPVLVCSNHPGSIDGLAIAPCLQRADVKIVVSSIPFIQDLPATSSHMIWSSTETHRRMLTIRSIIQALQDGRVVIIFPSGTVDPDPDRMPGASEAILSWSHSLEVILRKVPATCFLGAIVSGVVDADLLNHPLPRLRREPRSRQKTAELLHGLRDMGAPGRIRTSTRISFDYPRAANDLPREKGALQQTILGNMLALLSNHTGSGNWTS